MKITKILLLLSSAIAAAAVLSPVAATGPAPNARDHQAGPGSQRCSLSSLQGSYGLRFEGTKIGVGPFASISRITFDGQGQFTTSEIGRFNGNPVQRTFTGPYVVNDDCTGFLDFSSNLGNNPHQVHGDFVIVDEGREFFVLDNEDGWVATGVGKQI